MTSVHAMETLSPRRLAALQRRSSGALARVTEGAEPLRVAVGGRVSRFEPASRQLWLTDGFATALVELAGATVFPSPAPGCWVKVSGVVKVVGTAFALADLDADVVLGAGHVEGVHPGRAGLSAETRGLCAKLPRLGEMARAKAAARRFFDERGYLEVTTPIRVDAPGTDVYIEPHATSDGWLITSPEFQMKRLLAAGCDRIYQFASCTREKERGSWHQPEFTLLEWYAAFEGLPELLEVTELLTSELVGWIAGADRVNVRGLEVEVRPPFERVSVRDAFRTYAGVEDVADLAQSDEARYFQLLVDRVEPALARVDRALFLCDYPSSQAALARRKSTDPAYAERFELFIGGVELCNGYGELTDPVEQRQRFERDRRERARRGLPDLPIDEALLVALEDGLPPCSGNALGFERLLAIASGAALADVIAFPRRST